MIAPPILIVDDETDLLDLFSVMLRRLPYPVVTASSGEAALRILQQTTPVLIILDIAMAYPNGLDILRHTRADSRFNATKIMILTAVPGRVAKTDADLADLMLAKPVSARELEQTVVNLLDTN